MVAGPDVHLWWADLTAADAALEATLPPSERARLEGLDGAARARRMVGAALLRQAVRAHRGEEAEVAVDRTCEECGAQHGRPVVAGGPHVSVAHAGVLVVVATCGTAPVGVDVERVSRFSGEQEPAAAAAAWVAHEARLKAGEGDGVASGSDAPEPPVLSLEPPLPGYAAALRVAAAGPSGVRLVVHR
ncbi:MAG: hypothetical protein DCC50_01825 [Acidobacteria bacterium]|nr:MAG: hypothetical protein DCC50_01825 [Acidobacteriota bacterium]